MVESVKSIKKKEIRVKPKKCGVLAARKSHPRRTLKKAFRLLLEVDIWLISKHANVPPPRNKDPPRKSLLRNNGWLIITWNPEKNRHVLKDGHCNFQQFPIRASQSPKLITAQVSTRMKILR